MRRLCGLLIVSCFLLAACGSGGSGGSSPPPITTLYVRASGDDDASGTSPDEALKTVARAGQFLDPGVTVYVGPGSYEGGIDIANVEATESAPIRLLADPQGARTGDAPGEVILDADGDTFAVRVSNTPFVTVDGFSITGAADDSSGIIVRSTSANVTIRNCVISNGGPADGIRLQNSNDALVFNNLIFDNDRGIRIQNGSQGAQIINNTIADNRRGGVSITGANAGGVASTDATVRNNVIQNSRNNVSISVDDGPPSSLPGYEGNFNLAFVQDLADPLNTYRPEDIRGDDDVNEDALFIDAENGDYHLADDSPARDQGTGALDPLLLNELFQRSTTADGAVDAPPVDMGYHYPR